MKISVTWSAEARRRLTHYLFLICTTTLTLAGGTVRAQNQSKGTMYYACKGVLTDAGYTIADEEHYCDLAQGGSAEFYRTFNVDTHYSIFALADDSDVTDVDLYVYYWDGDQWQEYRKDNDSNPRAAVEFTPSVSRRLKIVYKNYASKTPRYYSTLRVLIGYQ